MRILFHRARVTGLPGTLHFRVGMNGEGAGSTLHVTVFYRARREARFEQSLGRKERSLPRPSPWA